MNNREAHQAVDSALKFKERVSIALQAYGTQEVYFELDTLSGATGLTRAQVYNTLYRMAMTGALEIIVEEVGNGHSKKVVGVKLIKLEAASTILEDVPARSNVQNHIPKSTKKAELKIHELAPTIMSYMEKKLVIDKVRVEVAEVGLNPDDVVNFEVSNVCEEGILLLDAWATLQKSYNDLAIRSEAMARENNLLKGYKQPMPEITSRERETVLA